MAAERCRLTNRRPVVLNAHDFPVGVVQRAAPVAHHGAAGGGPDEAAEGIDARPAEEILSARPGPWGPPFEARPPDPLGRRIRIKRQADTMLLTEYSKTTICGLPADTRRPEEIEVPARETTLGHGVVEQ